MSGAITLFEPCRRVVARDAWHIDQIGYVCEVDAVPERVPAWHVSIGPQEIGRIQWAELEHGVPSSRLYWGTLADGGACPGTTLVGHSLEECADRMVRRWLGVPMPEEVAA